MSTRSKRTTRGDASASAAAVLAAGVAAAALPSDATAAAPAAAESAPSAAAPRSAKKSKSKAKQAEPAAMEDVQEEEVAAVSAAAVASSSESSGGWSVAALLAGVNGRQVAEDGTEAAAQMRTLQQAILKQANSRASDLLHPDLWPSFLARLERLQANTVRLDVHLLPAISRTVAEMFAAANRGAADSFALMPDLQRVVQLLLPCDSTPVAQSWASTFHPNYELLSTFLFALMRLVLAQAALQNGSGLAALPASVYQFMSAVLAAFTLVNAAQNAQRKVYEQALQERNLPVWALLHQSLMRQLQLQSQPSSDAQSASMRECATRVEQLIDGVLFHAEHLGLYADALGMGAKAAREEDDEDSSDEEEEEAAGANKEKDEAADVDADADAEDAPAKADGAEGEDVAAADEDDNDKPAGKKAKLDAAGKAAKPGRAAAGKGKAKPSAAKPQPNNYTNKLFETVQRWINKEEPSEPAAAATAAPVDAKAAGKKRKVADTAAESPASSATAATAASPAPFSSRAIRAALPLLFAGYVSASEAAYRALYPSSGTSAGEGEKEGALSPLEMRRKKSRERIKGEQELKFLQKMWQLNENAPAASAATSAASPASSSQLVSPVFSAPLTRQTLPVLHDMFATNARLFQLVHAHDIYKINQDANVSSSSSAAAAFTGLKKVLADQMHQVMAVARSIILQSQAQAQEEASSTKKKAKSSKASSAAPAASESLSTAELLALSIPLASNVLHLLQLNPEFVGRYLYVRSTKQSPSSRLRAAAADVNVWHLVWKVIQLAGRLGSSSEPASAPAVVSTLSPPSKALPAIRALSQEIFLSYSKLRQHDVLFNSYLSAARSACHLDPAMPLAPFATVNGPRFQLALLMRNIPPLKVPALWEWFLGQCALHLAEDDGEEKPSRSSSETLLHFFTFFLDSILVREEIAMQLQVLFGRTMCDVIAKPLTALLRAHLQPSSSGATATVAAVPLSSLLLLLHSLNDVKAQCDQHTTKTYETMMQPLQSYFHAIDESAAAAAAAAETDVVTGGKAIRLTEVIESLSVQSARDPALLHSLHLLSLQRLHQLYRFQQRNIVTNLFENDAAADLDDEDDDESMDSDSDDDEEEKEAKKKSKAAKAAAAAAGQSAPKRLPQTHKQESEALATFLMGEHRHCACYAAPSAAEHALYAWDGAAASLAGAGKAGAAVALWNLLAGNLDVLAHFASVEQRRQLVAHVFAISACAHCHAASAPAAETTKAASAASLHTLRSITTSLFTQPWVYEIPSLRAVIMDVAASSLLATAAALHSALDSKVRKAASAASSLPGMTIPAEFALTAALGSELTSVRQFAQHASTTPVSSSSSSSSEVSGQKIWECIWLLQLLHSFPSQYFLSQPHFHALLVQVVWALESLACALSGPKAQEAGAQPLSLAQLARGASSPEVDRAALLSHLVLSSRRMMLSSLGALSASSSAILGGMVSPAMLGWVCWGAFGSSGALQGRHVLFAREATRRCVNILAPALLARQKVLQAKADKEDAAAAADAGVKKKKSSSKSDKPAAASGTAPTSALLPVIERIHQAMEALTAKSSAAAKAEAVWCAGLASSLVDAFVPGWDLPSGSAQLADSLAKHFRVVRDAPLVFELLQRLGNTLREKMLPLLGSGGAQDDEMVGCVLDLHARLLVNLYAYKASTAAEKDKVPAVAPESESKLDSSLLAAAGSSLSVAVSALTAGNRSQAAKVGAATYIQALCVILPLFQSEGVPAVTFSGLVRAVSDVSAADAQARLGMGLQGKGASVLTGPIHASWASLMSHASEAQCAEMVGHSLAGLDPSFAQAMPLDVDEQGNETEAPSAAVSSHAKLSSSLQLLLVYIQHMQSSSQRRALSHAHLSLLLYRLAALSSDWAGQYLSRTSTGGGCVVLAGGALALVAHVLSRHQVFVLDDSALAMLAHTLANVAAMLKDSFPRQRGGTGGRATALQLGGEAAGAPESDSSASALYHPLYLSLYSLLKFHPSSTIKIVPIYLSLLRTLMEHQWRQIQHMDPSTPVPVSVSENLARVLEEVGRSTHSKLFNKYAVGVLLEWINLSKHKGAAWGHAAQEPHVRAVHKGLFAIIAICEEHDLSQLNNLLDVAGRTIFRTLHQAFKKTRFTGLV